MRDSARETRLFSGWSWHSRSVSPNPFSRFSSHLRRIASRLLSAEGGRDRLPGPGPTKPSPPLGVFVLVQIPITVRCSNVVRRIQIIGCCLVPVFAFGSKMFDQSFCPTAVAQPLTVTLPAISVISTVLVKVMSLPLPGLYHVCQPLRTTPGAGGAE